MQHQNTVHVGCTVAALKLSCTHLAVGSFNASASLWTLSSGELFGTFVGHTSAVFSVNFNLVRDIFVTGSADMSVILWSLTDRTAFHLFKTSFKPSSVCLVFPSDLSDSFLLAANGSSQRQAKVWLVKCHVANDSKQCVSWHVKLQNDVFVVTEDEPTEREFYSSVDVACNRMLVLTAESLGYLEPKVVIHQYMIGFECGENTGQSRIEFHAHGAAISQGPPERLLFSKCRCVLPGLSISSRYLLQLLGAGFRFNVYLLRREGHNELLILRIGTSRITEVGRWHLPNNLRFLNVQLFYIAF